jgi:hypothetical protein
VGEYRTSRDPNISSLRIVVNIFHEVRDGWVAVEYRIANFEFTWHADSFPQFAKLTKPVEFQTAPLPKNVAPRMGSVLYGALLGFGQLLSRPFFCQTFLMDGKAVPIGFAGFTVAGFLADGAKERVGVLRIW